MIIFCLQATNDLPKEILFDYAYIDNIKKVILLDTYHRTSLNYTQLAAYIYEKNAGKVDRTYKIQNVIKNLHPDAPSLGVQSLRNIIRFSEVTPLLARLLAIGGIWELLCEKTYERLMKCRSERVRLLVFGLCFLCLSVFVGYSIRNSCMLGPSRGHRHGP